MGRNIIEERLNRGLSRRQLADELGVSPRVIEYAEQGGRPHPRNAKKIADFFDCRVTDIWPLAPEETAA